MSQLLRAGGWVPAHSIPGDPTGTNCAFCGRLIDERGGWVSVSARAFVCADCLPDPDAEDAGEQAATRVAQRQQDEWRDWPL